MQVSVRNIIQGCLSCLLFFGNPAMGCGVEQYIQITTPANVISYFQDQKKKVVTFVGYSGAGYEDKDEMLAKVKIILDQYSPESTIINIGATEAGIGSVYREAYNRGFMTTGIVSSLSQQYADPGFSSCASEIFVISDQQWGGYLSEEEGLSPVSEVMVEISDVIIGIGGGAIARDELQEASCRNKNVLFYPARMLKSKSTCQSDDCLAGEAAKAFADGIVSCE